jgi:signal recognition particle subunit SRP19
MQIQSLKVDNVPKRPYTLAQPKPVTTPPPPKGTKGKQAAVKTTPPNVSVCSGHRLAVPPEPHPPLATRVSAYSPAISTGVLVETVKAGMNAQESAGSGTSGVGVQKGKRKMVRVRG